MTQPNKIWCVVPVFNHSTTLRSVVKGVLKHIDDVVVVDDGSSDADIAKIVEGLPAHLLSHDENLGKGAALKHGAEFALERGCENVITIDADGQHDPNNIPRFLPLLLNSVNKIVVGQRDFSNEYVPMGSRFGRRFSDFWVSFETGIPIFDSQSGFRSYPALFLAKFKPIFNSYAFETEILVRGAWKGYLIDNVEISVTYTPGGKPRISHFNPLVDNLRISLLHSRLAIERLARIIRRGRQK